MNPTTLPGGGVLRPARPGDETGILQRIRDLASYEQEPDAVRTTAPALAESLFGPDPRVFAHVIDRDGGIAGIAVWFVTFSTWTGRHGIWLEDLFVREEDRRHGYGRALIASLAAVCVARGYARLEWTVLDRNEPALRFYRSLEAEPMAEWTTHRMTGNALTSLAERVTS